MAFFILSYLGYAMLIEGFVADVKTLINKLIKQNFEKCMLLSFVKKFIDKNHPCVFKLWSSIKMQMFM